MPFVVTPQPKKASDQMSSYLLYFGRIKAANDWNDEEAAKVFGGMLECGSTALDNLDASQLKSFKAIQDALSPSEQAFREARVQELFVMSMKPGERAEAFLSRVRQLIDSVYPKFASANREQLVRDRFVHGLSPDLKAAVLTNGANVKLNDVVTHAIMAEGVKETLESVVRPGHRTGRSAGNGGGTGNGGGRFDRDRGRDRGGGRQVTCFSCQGQGHRSRDCPQQSKDTPPPYRSHQQQSSSHSEGRRDRDRDREARGRRSGTGSGGVGACGFGRDNRPWLEVVVDGAPLRTLVDSGSVASILPRGQFVPTGSKKLVFSTANGQPLLIDGTRLCKVTCQGWTGQHKFFVGDVSLPVLGSDFLRKNGVMLDLSLIHI